MYSSTKFRHLRVYFFVAGFFFVQNIQAQLMVPTKCQLILKRVVDLEQKALSKVKSGLKHVERKVRNFYPIRMMRNNWARPKSPEVSWFTSMLNTWYYNPEVSFKDRRKIAELFMKHRKLGHRTIDGIKFSEEDTKLLDKFKLRDELNYFLKHKHYFTSGIAVDKVFNAVFSIVTYIPGVPTPRNLISNHVYNMALWNKINGRSPKDLKPWQQAFLKKHGMESRYNRYVEDLEKHPYASRLIRLAQNGVTAAIPILVALMNQTMDKVDENFVDQSQEDALDTANPESITARDMPEGRIEYVVIRKKDGTERVALRVHRVYYFVDEMYLDIVQTRKLLDSDEFKGAKEVLRVRLRADPKKVDAFHERLVDLASYNHPLVTENNEYYPEGVTAMMLASELYDGDVGILSPELAQETELFFMNAQAQKLATEDNPNAMIEEIYKTKF